MKRFGILFLLFLLPFSFHAQTAKTAEKFINANADGAATVTDNSVLYFYTVHELSFGTVVIPIHTRFSATVQLRGGRAFMNVRSIKIKEEIYNVDWRVVGPDYEEGLPFIETEKSLEVYEDQQVRFKTFP